MKEAGTASVSASSWWSRGWSLLIGLLGAVWGSLWRRLGFGLTLEASGSTAPPPDLSSEASTSTAPPPTTFVFTKPPKKLNESIYVVREPTGTLNMEILFFHGLQFKDSSDTYCWSTWESRDGSCVWPEKWLGDDFPGAKVMFVSYDGALTARKSHSFDLYIIIENLIQDIVMAGTIGQRPNCPVIVVGHCFGGLIIKQLCLSMRRKMESTKSETEKIRLRTFLDNLQGIFYYDAPHRGIPSLDTATYVKHDPLLAYFRTQSEDIARLNQEFSELCTKYQWHIHGLGASLKTRLSIIQNIMVVPEASGRDGVFFNVAENVDHFTVCKPADKISRSFYALKYLLDKISAEREMVFPCHKCHGIPKHCPGLDKHTYRVQEMLASASVVGIVGMGGLGKTTISKSVFNCISREFEYACFVENVKTIPNYQLKDWVLKQFHRNGVKVDEKVTSWSQLENKKTLMVVDDVDSESQLKILPDLGSFGKGTRLIITSRDQGILKIFEDYMVYDVEFLGDDEARELLCLYAFGKEGVTNNLNVSMERSIRGVVEKCQGLPLTLEVIGCYLRGFHNRPDFWKKVLLRLGEAQGIDGSTKDRVWASLQVSFEALRQEEQEMFIEAGTYFFGKPVERALSAWSATNACSGVVWANLLSKSMVKESGERNEEKTVWVHEHLRDLAKSVKEVLMISPDGSDHEVNKAVDLLNADGVNPETSMVRLCYGWGYGWGSSHIKTLRLESLEKLEKLKYLELGAVVHAGTWKNSPRSLSLLNWTSREFDRPRFREDRSEMPILPINLDEVNNLAILELESWKVHKEFPKTLGNLTKMRILSLVDLQGWGCSANDLGKLSGLKQLSLAALKELTELGDSFGNLPALKVLLLKFCPRLERLPANFGGLSALEELTLEHCDGLRELPDSFGKLSGLKQLRLAALEELTELGDSFGNLPALKVLLLEDCPRLERLPANFGGLSALEELTLEYCDGLRELPDSFGKLSALKRLRIRSCENIEVLPDSFSRLRSLEVLDVPGCAKLKRLPEAFGELAALRDLLIYDLEMLPNSIGKLSSLEKLTIYSTKLESIPESLGDLQSLRELRLWGIRSLRNFPKKFGKLSSLQFLGIYDGDVLERLPEFENLSSLEKIEIRGCRKIKYIPSSLWHAPSLREVKLARCPELQTLASPQGARSQEPRNLEAGQSSRIAATVGISLFCGEDCGLIDESTLEGWGWTRTGTEAFFVLSMANEYKRAVSSLGIY